MESSAAAQARTACWRSSRDRLVRMLRYMLDEREFLSPFGVRSVSRVHEAHPFTLRYNSVEHRVAYTPASRQRRSSAATRTGAGRSGCR